MSVGKRIAGVILFFLIGIGMFLGVQEVLTPDWSNVNADMTFYGFSSLRDNSIDVLLLGSSTIQYGISPMRLYENTNICSYSLATSAQTIEQSYFLAKEAFKTQTPSVVILDPSSLYYSEDGNYNGSWRYILDNLKLDVDKLEMLKTYDKMWYSDGWETVVFPIVKYHTRWNELTKNDFSKKLSVAPITGGTVIDSVTQSSYLSINTADEIVDGMKSRNLGTVSYYNKEISESLEKQIISDVLYDPEISDKSLAYLEKLNSLCRENRADLILVKIPSLRYPQVYSTAWSKTKSEQVKDLSKKYNIPFYDLMYDYDIVDFKCDTRDNGWHLNIRGAEKVTDALAKFLVDDFCLVGTTNATYDKILTDYNKVRKVAILQSETNFNHYIDLLNDDLSDWTVFLVGSDEFTSNLTETDFGQIEENLGLQLIDCADYADAYIAVIENREVLYEAVSDRKITHSLSVKKLPIILTASGWYSSPLASIKIGEVEHAINVRGLNFVILDNSTGLVIDSVSFNTFEAARPANRKAVRTYGYLRAYESKVCFSQ